MRNNNNLVDELLKKYVSEDSTEVGMDEFGKKVVNVLHNAANERGYDSLEDMISHKMSGNSNTKKPSLNKTCEYSCRFDYFMESLENINYDSNYRGYYKDGHMAALSRYMDKAQLNRNNLQIVEKTLKQELSQYRRSAETSMYSQGYLDGLRMVDKALKYSKKEMMKLINDTIMDALK